MQRCITAYYFVLDYINAHWYFGTSFWQLGAQWSGVLPLFSEQCGIIQLYCDRSWTCDRRKTLLHRGAHSSMQRRMKLGHYTVTYLWITPNPSVRWKRVLLGTLVWSEQQWYSCIDKVLDNRKCSTTTIIVQRNATACWSFVGHSKCL